MRKLYHDFKGFTLMELMVALAIFSVVIAGIVSSRYRQGEQNITQLQAVEMQQSARAAIFMIKRELKMAGFNDLLTDYGAGISVATPTKITFSGVVDDIGTLDTITYEHRDMGGDVDFDIAREINGASNTLAENINTLLFEYFDSDGNALAATPADPDDIRSVQITITSAVDIGHRSAGAANNDTRTLTTRVWLRNMGL